MPTALLSVFDKAGLIDLASALVDMGWNLLASGGTAETLRNHGCPVREVSDFTGFPELLGGRVKTLHPAIHAGILARPTPEDQSQLHQHGLTAIDMVVVNLYPFEQVVASPASTPEDIIENIDIGGVALMRAAAKAYERVALLCDPEDYPAITDHLKNGNLDLGLRKSLAKKGFQTTAKYDAAISEYFTGPASIEITGYQIQNLRYGENPHQSAALYSYAPESGPLGGKVLQGKELSYNNLLDLDAAWRAVTSFAASTICIVKHLSPCGIASAPRQIDAYRSALASDPVSAFGGIVSSNRPIDAETAAAMRDLFIECIIAPGFEPDAQELLARKKNCRLVEMPQLDIQPEYEFRSVVGGFLKQSLDFGDPPATEWRVVTERQPTAQERTDLEFAWKACLHVRSNAIVLATNNATIGIGGGQPNRVDSVRIAIDRAGERVSGAVLASDAFFPFADSVETAVKAGVTAIIQPGGSVRDAESIEAANASGLAMIFTGTRHFRH
jgi:phosphoribosylaminoimidazolecarboxamide formyltransferase/IMP cyclohydrolase